MTPKLLASQIAAEYAAGATYHTLCQAHGIHADTLRRILRDHHVPPRRRGRPRDIGPCGAVRRVECLRGLTYHDGTRRLCVLADLDGACGLCVASVESVAGIRSTLSAEEVRLS